MPNEAPGGINILTESQPLLAKSLCCFKAANPFITSMYKEKLRMPNEAPGGINIPHRVTAIAGQVTLLLQGSQSIHNIYVQGKIKNAQ